MVVITMRKINSSEEELLNHIANMNSEKSVLQFSIPGKGKFTLFLQAEDERYIKDEVEEKS